VADLNGNSVQLRTKQKTAYSKWIINWWWSRSACQNFKLNCIPWNSRWKNIYRRREKPYTPCRISCVSRRWGEKKLI
jgi:hypothetical protein